MQEALLYDREDDQTVLCRLCPWNCRIPPGEYGICRVRRNREGRLYTLNYGLISAAAIEPIERRGIYHLFPGSTILLLGGWGNSLRCHHTPPPPALPEEGDRRRFLNPERAIEFAMEHRCRGVAWGYQEPTVWLEYVLDTAKLAKANGLYTLLMTNGYITAEALDLLGPYLNAYAVEILGVSAAVYETLCSISGWAHILEAAQYAKERWRCHIEVHTPIVPGINQEDPQVRELASWIRDHLGPDTPWHLWRYLPAGEFADREPLPPEEMDKVEVVGHEAGLNYVYVQFEEEERLSSTRCPSCGQLLVQRGENYYVKVVGVEDSRCSRCGEAIYLSRTIFK